MESRVFFLEAILAFLKWITELGGGDTTKKHQNWSYI